MARPSFTPRLRDVDPEQLADEIARLVSEHAVSLLLQIGHDVTWSIPDHARLLRTEAAWLATYARRGLPVGD